jgi:hypothetical protein
MEGWVLHPLVFSVHINVQRHVIPDRGRGLPDRKMIELPRRVKFTAVGD